MAQTYSNNASSTLASGYTAGDSTITVQAGDGAKFPATGDFMLAIDDPVSFYLKCTSRSTDVLTVSTTGQESTSAANKASGVHVNHVITAGALTALLAAAGGGGTVTHTGGSLTNNLPVLGAGSADVKIGTAAQLVPTLPADATKFLDGTGAFSTPSGAGTVTHTAGALTSNLPVLGAGSADVKIGTAAQLVPSLPADATKYLDGTGAFSTPSSGALVLLEQHTASGSATLDFTTCLTSSYDTYLIMITRLVPATNAVDLYMRLSTNGGSTYDTNTIYIIEDFRWINAASAASGSTDGAFHLNNTSDHLANTSNYGFCGKYELFDPLGSGYKMLSGQSVWWTSGSVRIGTGTVGQYESTTAVNAMRFLFSSGNIASGTIRVYGYAK